jgi:hypothetical protein
MATFLDALRGALAADAPPAAPAAATPAFPLTAPDLRCLEDLDRFAAETTTELENLDQDVLHILMEDYGSNPDDITRGIGVPNLLSASTRSIAHITTLVETQLRKDDRIDQVRATLTELPPGYAFPDGLTFAAGGWLLELQIVAGPGTVGLSYGYSPATGMVSR